MCTVQSNLEIKTILVLSKTGLSSQVVFVHKLKFIKRGEVVVFAERWSLFKGGPLTQVSMYLAFEYMLFGFGDHTKYKILVHSIYNKDLILGYNKLNIIRTHF